MLYYMIKKNAHIVFNGVSDTGNISMQDILMQMKWNKQNLHLSPANVPIICYLQSTVTSKFTEYLLLTVDCHQPLRYLFLFYDLI